MRVRDGERRGDGGIVAEGCRFLRDADLGLAAGDGGVEPVAALAAVGGVVAGGAEDHVVVVCADVAPGDGDRDGELGAADGAGGGEGEGGPRRRPR